VITPDQKFRKRLKPQNTVYSAEQEEIIKVIYVTHRTVERQVSVEGDIKSKIQKHCHTENNTGRRKRESHPSQDARPYRNTTK
jgi:hypothetical protein